MTGWLWLVGLLCTPFVVVLGLRRVGHRRWTEAIQEHVRLLESGRLDARHRLTTAERFDARELEDLPAPVERYFRAVLTDGQPIVSAVNIEMTGLINLAANAEQWKSFTSHQRIVTRKPGFLWNAQVKIFAGVPASVLDSYIAGQGHLTAKIIGLFTVAELKGTGEIARGELMRYFAEAAWYPTALLPSQGVRWEAIDDASAKATLVDGPITLSLLVRFNEAGLISAVHAESRGASQGKNGVMVMLPWDCTWSSYRRQDGMRIPMTGEVAWVRPDGRKSYFVGHVKAVRYDFFP